MTSLLTPSQVLVACGNTLINKAYDEFCRRQAAGETIDMDAFWAEFPGVRPDLERTLEIHGYLAEHGELTEAGPADYWPIAGQVFSGFHLKRELGRGSFARVFLAEEQALGKRKVAVKISFRGSVEAATLGRLDHPNIVPVFSVQEHAPTQLALICMPYLGKVTLDEVLLPILGDEAPPHHADFLADLAADPEAPDQSPARLAPKTPWVETVRWLAGQMFDALAFMHARGIIHRDLKPSNVLIKPDGTPMLLDFNLAADVLLPELICGGTPDFMAPEQLQGHAKFIIPPPEVTAAADVFSLGVILFELLTGQHPFGPLTGATSVKQFVKWLAVRQQEGPRSLRRLNPGVDRELAQLIESCLAYSPTARPSAAAAAAQLKRRQAWLPSTRRVLTRHPLWTAAASGLIVLVLTGAAWAVMAPRDLAHPQPASPNATPSGTMTDAYQQGDFPLAIRRANLVLETTPDNLDARYLRGRAHLRLGEQDANNFSLAYTDFRDCFEQKADGRFQACMGYCLQRMGQNPSAALFYENALASGFESAELHNNLGQAYLGRTQYQAEAQLHLEKAITMKPQLGSAHQLLAIAHLKKAHQAKPGSRRDLLAKSLEHNGKALGFMKPPATDVLLQTGKIHALAAEYDPQLLPKAMVYLKQACDQGLDLEILKGLSTFPALEKNDDFQNLLQRPQSKRQATLAVLVLDPVMD